MRLIDIVLCVLLTSVTALAGEYDRQVIVNGRVATFGSVVEYCDGDTASAAAMCVPLPVAGSYLSQPRVVAECLYNSLRIPLWPVVVTIICAASIFVCNAPLWIWPALSALASAVCCALSWWLGGWIPLMSGADTLSAIGLILCVVLAFVHRRNVVAAGLVVVALLWGVAFCIGAHPAVRPLNPALMSSWLPVHVTLMMLAYAMFLLSAVFAAAAPVNVRVRGLLWCGEIMLLCGIVTGGLWAMNAWGHFWAWDPKENLALATALIYAVLLTVWNRLEERPGLRRAFVVTALAVVVFTWWGASCFGGLHAY